MNPHSESGVAWVRPRRQLLRGLCAFASLLVGLLASEHVFAQANYDAAMLGGRTSMMGGAGVARGSDGATAFINPAGLTRIMGESFSFQTVALQASSRWIQGILDPGAELGLATTTASDFGLRILPNTFCLFLDGPPKDSYSGRSRHKYGVCAADVEKEQFFLSSNQSGRGFAGIRPSSSQTTQMEFARSALALSWGFELFKGTSIGVSARVENTRLKDQTTSTVFGTAVGGRGAFEMTHSIASSSWDSAITIGLTHQISRSITVGASLTTPGLHFIGQHRGSVSYLSSVGAESSLYQDSGDFRYNQPAALRLGLAFFFPTLQIEINGNFYGAREALAEAQFTRNYTSTQENAPNFQDTSRVRTIEHGVPVANFAVGVEKFIARDYSLVLGFLTDMSGLVNRTTMSPEEILFRQRKDSFHASLGVASYGSQGHILLGLRGYYSTGEVLIADPNAPTPTFVPLPQTDVGASFVVSGQISFEAVRDTALRAAQPLSKLPSAIERRDDEEEPPKPEKKETP